MFANTSSVRHGQYKSELWVGDTGATHHFTGSTEGMYEFGPTKGKVVQTPSGTMELAGYGNIRVKYKNDDGKVVYIILENVAYAPGSSENLISLNAFANNKVFSYVTDNGVRVSRLKMSFVRPNQHVLPRILMHRLPPPFP